MLDSKQKQAHLLANLIKHSKIQEPEKSPVEVYVSRPNFSQLQGPESQRLPFLY